MPTRLVNWCPVASSRALKNLEIAVPETPGAWITRGPRYFRYGAALGLVGCASDANSPWERKPEETRRLLEVDCTCARVKSSQCRSETSDLAD